jgi:hypothetical protein
MVLVVRGVEKERERPTRLHKAENTQVKQWQAYYTRTNTHMPRQQNGLPDYSKVMIIKIRRPLFYCAFARSVVACKARAT